MRCKLTRVIFDVPIFSRASRPVRLFLFPLPRMSSFTWTRQELGFRKYCSMCQKETCIESHAKLAFLKSCRVLYAAPEIDFYDNRPILVWWTSDVSKHIGERQPHKEAKKQLCARYSVKGYVIAGLYQTLPFSFCYIYNFWLLLLWYLHGYRRLRDNFLVCWSATWHLKQVYFPKWR